MVSSGRGSCVVSTSGGLCGVCVVSVCVGPGVSSMVRVLRTCSVGNGFHALHWYMLSCLCCCVVGFRCLPIVCILRRGVSGLILRVGGVIVVRVVGLGVCGLVSIIWVACFLSGGLGRVGVWVEVWIRVCLSMVLGFLFRVLEVVGGGECSDVSLKGGWACSAWCRRVRVAVWGVVRVGMRLVMYVSNSPVRR